MSSHSYHFKVESIRCKACERRIRNWFVGDADIESVAVDLASQQVTILGRASGMEESLRARLHSAGYSPNP